jgi:hypothetical protein
MARNEQVIRALNEILTQIEAIAVRADAIFELMLERGQINSQELASGMETAKARQQAKWAQIRAKVGAFLEEEGGKPTAKVA